MDYNERKARRAQARNPNGTLGGGFDIPDIWAAMRSNLDSHPIYGGVGKNLGEDVLYDNVDAITGEVRNSPNVVNIPLVPEEASTAIVDYLGTPSYEDLAPVDVMGNRIQTPDLAPEDALAPEQAAQEKVIDNPNQDAIVQEMKAFASQGGASKEDVGFMETFGDKFDMTTFGMALLASSDDGSSLGAGIGKALMLARAAKMNQTATDSASAAAGREEGRKEREVAVKEANAITSARAEARQARTGIKPDKRHTAIATGFLMDNPNFKLADADGGLPVLADVMAANLAEAEAIQASLPADSRMPHAALLEATAKYSIQELNWERQSRLLGLGAPVYGHE